MEPRSDPRLARCLIGRTSEWYIATVTFTIEIELEQDGRWVAEVKNLSGVMA